LYPGLNRSIHMNDEEERIIQARNRGQFADRSEEYLESIVHSKGKSLNRLVDIIMPKPSWQVLDVATGAGHTGIALARRVISVTAIDLTPSMLVTAREQAHTLELGNINYCQAAAEELPFKDGSFDLLICRIAAHHFSNISSFMNSAARSLSAGGCLVVVDNVIPGVFSDKNRYKDPEKVGQFINAFERLRDPSHQRCLSVDEWTERYYSAGFRVTHIETIKTELIFGTWVTRSGVNSADVIRLRTMLIQAPAESKAVLDPQLIGGELSFKLTEAIIVGKRDT